MTKRNAIEVTVSRETEVNDAGTSKDLEVGENIEDTQQSSGMLVRLDYLGRDAIISESDLGRLMCRHPASVRRAVERKELPTPVRLAGQRVWTVNNLVKFIEARLDRAQAKAEKEEARIARINLRT